MNTNTKHGKTNRELPHGSYNSLSARRNFVLGLAGLTCAISPMVSWAVKVEKIDFYSVRTCQCCMGWVKYMEANGFIVAINWLEKSSQVIQLKRDNNVPDELYGCHTSFIGDYIFEGHVAAQDIRTILQDRPNIRGLSVPGMPQGSPGMEGPKPERYNTYTIPITGEPTIFRPYTET